MPFDGARWAIELAAVDRTAQAFSSVDRRMQKLRASTEAASAPLGGVGAAGIEKLNGVLGKLAAAYGAVEIGRKIWDAGMKAADLGEQAEQIGVNTEQLQAYRFAGAQAGVQAEQMDKAIVKLAQSMGTAAGGNKEMIELFQRLGVRILDADGKMRSAADVLPEVSKGLLGVGSSSQRTADAMTLLGKGGAKMTTVLGELAKGNEAVIESARKQGGVLEQDVIEAWDNVSDSLVRAGAAADVTYAKIAAPIATAGLEAVQKVLGFINSQFTEIANSIALINTHRGVLEQIMEVVNVLSGGLGPRIVGKDALTRAAEGIDRARAAAVEAEVELQRLQAMAAQTGMGYRYESAIEAQRKRVEQTKQEVKEAESVLDGFNAKKAGTMSPTTVTAPRLGVSNPVPTGQADAYQKIIDGAKQYIALKNIETQSIGMNVEAAARLKHEQELLGKATAGNIALGPQQTAQLKDLAAAMAQADATFASANFMDEAETKAKEFGSTQEMERAALFMSAEAAAAYRIEQDLLSAAKAKGIVLTATEIAQIRELAAAQAAAGETTRQTREWVDLGKDSMKGFFADVRQGAIEGKSAMEIFGTGYLNVLDKISSKLMQMAVDDLFDAAFGGAKGGGGGSGGGFLGGVFSAIGGALSGAFGGGVSAGSGMTFANGGQTPVGIPYLVGERGPEVRLDGRPGQIFNRGQWHAAGGRGGQQQPVVVYVTGDTDLVRVHAEAAAVKVVTQAEPRIVGRSVKQSTRLAPAAVARRTAERDGEWRPGGA